MVTALPYIAVALLLLWLYKREQQQLQRPQQRLNTLSPEGNGGHRVSRSAANAAFIIVWLFIGFRGHLYSDFINYYPFYEDLPTINRLTAASFTRYMFEPGFVIYSSVVKSLGFDYFGWVAVGSFIDLWVCRQTFRRYSSSLVLPFLFFIAYNGLVIEFNLYRNAKAIDLFLLSLPALEHRRATRYMLLNTLGITFHLSSVVYLPAYFVLHRNIGSAVRWCGIVFANIIFLGRINVVNRIILSLGVLQPTVLYDKLTSHVQHSTASYALSFGHIERTIAILLFTVLYGRMEQQRRSNRIFYNCLWIYYVTFLIFHEIEVLATRIPILFVCGYWILYTNVATLRFRWRQVVLLAAIALAFAKIITANLSPAARYDNLLFGIEEYASRRREVLPLLEKD